MAKDKNSFVLYANYIDVIEALTDEEAGKLIKHIFQYVNDLNPEEPTNPTIKIAWVGIKRQLKEDLKKYEQKRIQMQTNVNKRYLKNTKEEENLQMNTNEYKSIQIDSVNVNVNVNDNVNENVDSNNIDNNNIDKQINRKEEKVFIDNSNNTIYRNNTNTSFHNELVDKWISMLELYNYITDDEELDFPHYKSYMSYLLTLYDSTNIEQAIKYFLNETCDFGVYTGIKYDLHIENKLSYFKTCIKNSCERFRKD